MTGNNPQVPTSMVVYNFVDKEYKGIPGAADEHIAVHLHISGAVLHTELSEEGSEQKSWERNYKASVEERRRDKMRAAQEEGKEISDLDLDDDLQRNQFNYTERAAQTYVAQTKHRVISTEPPHTAESSGSMSQWRIYDAYMAEFERLQAAANAEKLAMGGKGAAAAAAALAGGGGATQSLGGDTLLSRVISQASATYGVGHRKGPLEDPMHSPEMKHSLQIMERLVSQNAEDEVYSDFKYWEDASDAFRDNVGTCLPLWKFEDSKTKKAAASSASGASSKQVTAIAWNCGHNDLFAVGYGSYDMLRQGSGG
jgi:dynein intermediate chain 1, axonemal